MRRSDQRRDAVFACYQRDVTGRPLAELIADSRPFTRELAEAVEADREEPDAPGRGGARGGEQSGHIIDTGFVATGDGIAAALMTMRELAGRDLAVAEPMAGAPLRE